ncbi:MAG: hypothetical protein DHS20C01_19360 [marine bacterium B5-7]|nr:MAG: hypothetical protein DHS20C01_19360 [marine bacterium B5-7]
MLRLRKTITAIGLASGLMISMSYAPQLFAQTYPNDSGCKKIENPTVEQKGWCVAIDRRKGNCLACHTIMVDPWPEGFPPGGNVAPALVSMKDRFPDPAKLRAQIYDSTAMNPNTRMPPFGKHKMLTDEQIDEIVAFLMTI